ncbi:hypothetical protein E3U47_08950 [Pseudomonas sp. RIT623]|nr:hypothetical protein E3U47_08950 [Pseudomonas sp. RIT623]
MWKWRPTPPDSGTQQSHTKKPAQAGFFASGDCGVHGGVTHALCRSGLVSRKGRAAAPAIFASTLKSRGRLAALSRHKAAPTTGTA